jgi:hypothetical protein
MSLLRIVLLLHRITHFLFVLSSQKTTKFDKQSVYSFGTGFGSYPKNSVFTGAGQLSVDKEGNTYKARPRKDLPGPGDYEHYNTLEGGKAYKTSGIKEDKGRSFGNAPPTDKGRYPFMA